MLGHYGYAAPTTGSSFAARLAATTPRRPCAVGVCGRKMPPASVACGIVVNQCLERMRNLPASPAPRIRFTYQPWWDSRLTPVTFSFEGYNDDDLIAYMLRTE